MKLRVDFFFGKGPFDSVFCTARCEVPAIEVTVNGPSERDALLVVTNAIYDRMAGEVLRKIEKKKEKAI